MLTRQPDRDGRRLGVAAVATDLANALPAARSGLRIVEPPHRQRQPIERVRRLLQRQRRLETATSRSPLAPGQGGGAGHELLVGVHVLDDRTDLHLAELERSGTLPSRQPPTRVVLVGRNQRHGGATVARFLDGRLGELDHVSPSLARRSQTVEGSDWLRGPVVQCTWNQPNALMARATSATCLTGAPPPDLCVADPALCRRSRRPTVRTCPRASPLCPPMPKRARDSAPAIPTTTATSR